MKTNSESPPEENNALIEFIKKGYPTLLHPDGICQYNGRGKVQDFTEKGNPEVVRIGTGSGAIVSKERKIGTDSLAGCLGVLIRGEKGNMMMHMTPTQGLGYMTTPPSRFSEEPLKKTLQIIAPSLEKIGPPKTLEVTIVSNVEGTNQESERQGELEALKSELLAQGFGHVKVVVVPLFETILYYDPAGYPDQLLAMGDDSYRTEEGGLLWPNKRKGPSSKWIDLDPNKEVVFELPTLDSEQVAEIQRKTMERWSNAM